MTCILLPHYLMSNEISFQKFLNFTIMVYLFCFLIDSSDSGDIDQPSLWLGLLACVVILSMVALLLGCLQCDLCPRRHGFGVSIEK